MQIPQLGIDAAEVLHHTSDGIYVVDLTCRILFWNQTAERITGYKAADVVGKRCKDDILVHVDRAGQRLCEPGLCPLHRCMKARRAATDNQLIYARTKDGPRVPVTISVSPILDPLGQVIGGVEVFRDESERVRDLERAQLVQRHSLPAAPPQGPVGCKALYEPHMLVGGDYYQVSALSGDRLAFLLADVAGHGVSSALYTMTLHSLWQTHRDLLERPQDFLSALNRDLAPLILGDAFATGMAGVVDPAAGSLAYAVAGHPPGLVRRRDGRVASLEVPDPPLGMLPSLEFSPAQVDLAPGDTLLVYTDGAVEAAAPTGEAYGQARLERELALGGAGPLDALLTDLRQSLGRHVQNAVLEDDLTMLALRHPAAHA